MNSEDSRPTENPSESSLDKGAARLYAEYLERLARGERFDFEDFVCEHPQEEKALRIFHSLHAHTVEFVSTESFADLVARHLGGERSARLCLDRETSSAGADEVSAVWQKSIADLAIRRHYSVRGELGQGGMGVVLKVWDEDLNRPLAMKVLRRTLSVERPRAEGDPSTLSRFLEEAQITGQLDHPGIVPVYEIGVDAEDGLFFTMQLVKGRDLRTIFDLARRGEEGWTQTRAIVVLIRVCEALAYAHSKGVIHRDVKPTNVMVGRFGEAYVMDWGLAKVIGREGARDLRWCQESAQSLSRIRTDRSRQAESGSDSPLITMDGTVVGTPAYMPPEQAEGRVEEISARSDVYSVGALLYELLTGQIPYVPPGARISPHTILSAVIQGPPRPIHEIDPSVQPELSAICEKAMARSMADRYADTGEMATDLQAYLDQRVVRAYQKGALAEFKKWVARNKGTAASIAAAPRSWSATSPTGR